MLDALVNSCHMATDGGVEVQTGQLLVWAVCFSLHSLKGVLHLSTALSLSSFSPHENCEQAIFQLFYIPDIIISH